MSGFKLQSVLDYRKIVEDRAMQGLAEAQGLERAQKETFAREEEHMRHLLGEFEQLQKDGICPHEISLYQGHISFRQQVLEQAQTRLDECRSNVEEKRRCLQDANRQKQLLENLKDKELTRQRKRQAARENAFFDEIAVQHFKR